MMNTQVVLAKARLSPDLSRIALATHKTQVPVAA